jgi:hypothetical protein
MIWRNAGEGPGSTGAAVHSLLSNSKTKRGRKLLEVGTLDQVGMRTASLAGPARLS